MHKLSSLTPLTHSHVFALLLCHLYNGLAISFFLSFDLSISLSAARGLRSILRNGAPRSFYRRRGRDGRVIVIAIIIITIIACDLPCL